MPTHAPKQLTESLEDYLEIILQLIEYEGHAHVHDIANRLKVKMPSVTGALRRLVEQNYIIYQPNRPVVLTPKGEETARLVLHKHTVLKRFFEKALGLEADKAAETACKLEHAVDEDTLQRFIDFTDNLTL
jgi:DtxR family Mn-dependent transcriptional regulator